LCGKGGCLASDLGGALAHKSKIACIQGWLRGNLDTSLAFVQKGMTTAQAWSDYL